MKRFVMMITTSTGWSVGFWLGEFINFYFGMLVSIAGMMGAWYVTEKLWKEYME